jgi:cyclase
MTEAIEIPTWETEMKEVAPNVYAYIQAKGSWFWSNAGLIVGDEYAIVVDSLATVALTRNFINEIKRVTDKPVRFLINTHHHGDHIWGNHLFRDATVICHSRCWEMARSTGLYDPNVLNALYPEFDFKGIKVTPPGMTFDKKFTIYLDDREVQLIHYEHAHTPGDLIVHLPQEKAIFAGDLLFLYSTPVGFEAHIQGWIEALDLMSYLDAETFVPGHGPVCNWEGLRECREYLAMIRYEARRRFDAGLDVYEAARSINLGSFKKWANWERIVINVERLYREFRHEDPTSPIDRAALFEQARKLVEAEGT